MKTNSRVSRLSAEEMITAYNSNEKSFEQCAAVFGCSVGGWAKNWHDKKCEELYDTVTNHAKKHICTCGNCNTVTSKEIYDSSIIPESLLNNTSDRSWVPNMHIPYDSRNVDCDLEDIIPAKYKAVFAGDDVREDDSETYSIAIISDLHLGSIYQQVSCLNEFTDICKDRGIETLLCAGDVCESLMPRSGHKNERFLHSIDEIEEYCAAVYPEGFNSYFILGNHDDALNKRLDGYDLGKNLCKDRKDLTYVPENPSLPDVVVVDGGLKVQMFHGASGCPKSRNRLMNKDTELRAMGQQYDVILGGHCHSSNYIPSYMGSILIGVASFQNLTPYLARKGLVSECGGLILSYKMKDGKPFGIIPEFVFAPELGGIRKDDY